MIVPPQEYRASQVGMDALRKPTRGSSQQVEKADTGSSRCNPPTRHTPLTINQRSFRDPQWSDLKISCGPLFWCVHRHIVCGLSPVFAAALKDGSFRESATGIYDIQERHPALVWVMLRHLYGFEYSFPEFVSAKCAETSAEAAMPLDHSSTVADANAIVSEEDDGEYDDIAVNSEERDGIVENDEDEQHGRQGKTSEPHDDGQRPCKKHREEDSIVERMSTYVPPDISEPINFHVHVYAIRHYYDIPTLQDAAKDAFKQVFHEGMTHPPFFDMALVAIHETTPVSDTGLRTLTREMLNFHRNTIFNSEGFTERTTPLPMGFITSQIQTLAAAPMPLEIKMYNCPRCFTVFHALPMKSGRIFYCQKANCTYREKDTEWLKRIVA